MSKQKFRKFRKNDYSYDDDEYAEFNYPKQDKRKSKRIDRALRTRDISILDEDDVAFDRRQERNRY